MELLVLGSEERHQVLDSHAAGLVCDAESSRPLCTGSLDSVQQKDVFKGSAEIDSLPDNAAAILNTALDSVAPLKTSQRTEENRRKHWFRRRSWRGYLTAPTLLEGSSDLIKHTNTRGWHGSPNHHRPWKLCLDSAHLHSSSRLDKLMRRASSVPSARRRCWEREGWRPSSQPRIRGPCNTCEYASVYIIYFSFVIIISFVLKRHFFTYKTLSTAVTMQTSPPWDK